MRPHTAVASAPLREQLAVALVQLHQVIFGALFILVVLVLPGGLVEAWTRLRDVARRRPRAGQP